MAKKHQSTSEPESSEQEQANLDTTEEQDLEVLPAEEQEEGAEQAPVSPLEKLQQDLDAAESKAAQNWDMYLRERAELENYRKRSQREKEEAIRFANDRLLKEMIPVLDNLERAVDHAEQEGGESESLLEGVNMTVSQFRKALEDFGIKPITALGETFDPNLHQAMGQLETEDFPANAVAAEYQKGYLLHDRLLRPSLVMVAKAPASSPEASQPDENDETAS